MNVRSPFWKQIAIKQPSRHPEKYLDHMMIEKGQWELIKPGEDLPTQNFENNVGHAVEGCIHSKPGLFDLSIEYGI